MESDLDNLFVIDKKGAESSRSSRIIYNFNGDLELGDNSPSNEAVAPSLPRPRRLVTGKRYHEVENFSNFRPGKLSDELRSALNLAAHELPLHIYRMRTLGYPPGWLKKARVGDHLAIFDSVSAFAENTEVTYNRDALIRYPGFNTQISYPFIDECDVLNCPRMQKHHMLENFYAALSSSSLRGGSPDTSKKNKSSELHQLWSEREQILAEIRRLDSKLVTKHPVSETGDNECFPEISCLQDHAQPGSTHIVQETTPSSRDADRVNSSAEASDHLDTEVLFIGESEDGTPTPNRSGLTNGRHVEEEGPSLKRPTIDAFSVGVQPYKPFENLPGSQGGFKRVLETLRNSRTESSSRGSSSELHVTNLSITVSKTFKSSTPTGHISFHSSRKSHSSHHSEYSVDLHR